MNIYQMTVNRLKESTMFDHSGRVVWKGKKGNFVYLYRYENIIKLAQPSQTKDEQLDFAQIAPDGTMTICDETTYQRWVNNIAS